MGLIERKIFPNETPIRIEYYPTEKELFATNYRYDGSLFYAIL
jgi:hypothetical protein